MKRKHAELIKQWAEDASLVVEVRMNDGSWRAVINHAWDERVEYRIAKPEPKKIKLVAFLDDWGCLRLVREELFESSNTFFHRVPSEDKEITLP